MNHNELRPSDALLRLANGYQVTQAIHVAATLGIADLLKDGPRASDTLAGATGTHSTALYRLLRALASVGVFREEADRTFALTPLGDCLRADAAEPVGPLARYFGGPHHWQVWGDLLHSIRTGQDANHHLYGMSEWDYRARHPEEEAIFDAAMTGNSRRQMAAVLAAYDFGRFAHIVDVGGGQGAMLAAILGRHAAASGLLFDQPSVVARAEAILEAAGVADRCRVVGGDFFAEVPTGGDAYLLKLILHDWDDERAAAILRTCRRAMAPTATLLLIERVLGPANEGAEAKFADLNMLVTLGGRERTREEWADLLASAGFRLAGVTATAAEVSVLEGALA